MGTVVVNLLSMVLMSFFFVYSLSILLNQDKRINKEKIISFIVICIYLYFSKLITDSFIRPFILYAVIVLSGIILEKNKVSKVAISAFISWMIAFVSEFFVAIIIMGMFGYTPENAKNDFDKGLIINILIFLISMLIINSKGISKSFKEYINRNVVKNSKYVVIILLMAAISLSIIFYMNYFTIDSA